MNPIAPFIIKTPLDELSGDETSARQSKKRKRVVFNPFPKSEEESKPKRIKLNERCN